MPKKNLESKKSYNSSSSSNNSLSTISSSSNSSSSSYERKILSDINLIDDYLNLKRENYKLKKELCEYKYKDIYNITLTDIYNQKILKEYINNYIDDFITKKYKKHQNRYDRNIIYEDIYEIINKKSIFEYLDYDETKIKNFLKTYKLIELKENKKDKINKSMLEKLNIFNKKNDNNLIKKRIKYYLKNNH